jgi:hypothetical protein
MQRLTCRMVDHLERTNAFSTLGATLHIGLSDLIFSGDTKRSKDTKIPVPYRYRKKWHRKFLKFS